MGWSSNIHVKDSIRLKSWKVCTNWGYVRSDATQNRIRIVRHGDSSEDIDAQLVKNWRQWWRGEKIRNSECETLTPGTGDLETGAVVKNRTGQISVEGGQGICDQWKEKGQCSKGDKCSFRHESNDHAQKPTPKAATPSEPSMTQGRSVSRKRSVRGRSQTGRILRQPCRYYLKGYLREIAFWILSFCRMSIFLSRNGM